MKIITKSLILMIITMFVMTISVYAADFSVKLENENLDDGIEIKLLLDQMNFTGLGINALIFDLEYDRNVFETVTSENITLLNGWEDLTYNPETGSLLTLRSDFTKLSGEEIVKIKLIKKMNAKSGETEIKIIGIQASNSTQDLEAENTIVVVNIENNNLIKTIITIVVIIIVLLFITRILIKNKQKRRKRR